MDILVMFFLLIIIQINTQGDLDRSHQPITGNHWIRGTHRNMRYMWWNNYMCEKPISPNGNEKDRERERARAWAPVLCSCQRHGGSSTTRRQARQRDQQPRNHGSRGKSPKGGAATREGQVWGTPVWRNACSFLSRLVTIVCCIMRNEISILAMLFPFFTYTKMMIISKWKNGFKNTTGILLMLI